MRGNAISRLASGKKEVFRRIVSPITRRLRRRGAHGSGFTLIELLVVMAIIGILITISVYVWNSAEQKSRDNTRKLNLNQINNALQQYANDNRDYPGFDTTACSGMIYSAQYQLGVSTNPSQSSTDNERLVPNYISSIPSDPQHSYANSSNCSNDQDQASEYLYVTAPTGSTTATSYQLMATMENSADSNTNTPWANFTDYNNNYKANQSPYNMYPNYVITGGSTRVNSGTSSVYEYNKGNGGGGGGGGSGGGGGIGTNGGQIIVHYIPQGTNLFNTAKTTGINYGANFPLNYSTTANGAGQLSQARYMLDMQTAEEAGVDGFAVENFVNSTGETGTDYMTPALISADALNLLGKTKVGGSFVVAPSIDTSGLSNTGVSDNDMEIDVEKSVETYIDAVENNKYSSADTTTDSNGKLEYVVYTYGTTNHYPVKDWEIIENDLASNKVKSYPVFWVDQTPTDTTQISSLFSVLGDAAYSFGDNCFPYPDSTNGCNNSNLPGYSNVASTLSNSPAKYFGGGWPGKLRGHPSATSSASDQANGSDALASQLYRTTLSDDLGASLQNWEINTWDDYIEHSNIDADADLGTLRLDITQWFASQYQHFTLPYTKPKLYITVPQALYQDQSKDFQGRTINAEALLLNPTSNTYQLTIQVGSCKSTVTVAPNSNTDVATCPIPLPSVSGSYSPVRATATATSGSTTMSITSAPTIFYSVNTPSTTINNCEAACVMYYSSEYQPGISMPANPSITNIVNSGSTDSVTVSVPKAPSGYSVYLIQVLHDQDLAGFDVAPSAGNNTFTVNDSIDQSSTGLSGTTNDHFNDPYDYDQFVARVIYKKNGTANSFNSFADDGDTPSDYITTYSDPTQYFDDEFTGAAGAQPDPTKWDIENTSTAQWGNACFVNDSQHVSLNGQGDLAETVTAGTANCGDTSIQETTGKPLQATKNYSYLSGGITTGLRTAGPWNFKYGSIVASIKVPTTAGAGVWPAWWAVGPNWPLGGEIDMLEMSQKTPSSSDPSGDQPNLAFQAINGPISSDNTTHWSIQGSSTATPEANLDGAFHTYGVNWSPGQIQFTLDGKPTQTYTSSDFKTYKNVQTNAIWPFDNSPERLLLNLQVQTGTTVPQTMLVDYVRSFGHN